MESAVIFIYLIMVFAIMGFIVWKIFGSFYSKQEQKNEEEYQHKREEYIESISPIITRCYNLLTNKINDKYPLIKFNFPDVKNIIETIPFPQNKELNILLKDLLEPIVDIARDNYMDKQFPIDAADIVNYNTNNVTSQLDLYTNPSDWNRKRELVYNRDNGSCKRCGVRLNLEQCHIHHLIRRSKGGGHELSNLVTLCRDCHSLMTGHTPLQGFREYYISASGLIHSSIDCSGKNSRKVKGSLLYLEHQGYTQCSKCKPERANWDAISDWEPNIKKFTLNQLVSIVHKL